MDSIIAITIRLNPGSYERPNIYGARLRCNNQMLLGEALDRYPPRHQRMTQLRECWFT